MSKYQTFNFDGYDFDLAAKTLSLDYSYDDALHFTEKFSFDFDFADYDNVVLDRAVQNLFFLAGVSYYKAFLAPGINVRVGKIDAQLADFLNQTYQRGLGEFFYVNKLSPVTPIDIPANSSTLARVKHSGRGLLIGLGGGKDSLVTVEALRSADKVATWSVGHRKQLQPLVDRIGLPHFWVEREWDQQLTTLNEQGAFNGHVPISAILAAAGNIVAVLSGYQDVVVSNEQSANEPTLEYQGVSINHQYSKSISFETDWQKLLDSQFGSSLRYYSFLRPLSELLIVEIFAKAALKKYISVFSSCNRAFRHGSSEMSWCGECAKCAFVYLALANFADKQDLDLIFDDKVLPLDSNLDTTYRQLLEIQGEKPLDCVGEIKECRAAMRRLQNRYPELNKFEFELDDNYDYRRLGSHSMPAEIFIKLEALLQSD